MRTNKLMAIVVALFVASCGLETAGLGEPDLDTQPDASLDAEPEETEEVDAEPDVDAPDVPDEDDAGENEVSDDAEPDEATPEETAEDVADTADDAEPDEADIADEATDEAGDEGGTEDSGTEDSDAEDGVVDPCALPTIPATGIFVFYCFDYEITSPMHLWLEIERGGVPVIPWSEAPGCSVASSRRLTCSLPIVWDALHKFNIELDPGVGIGWSCGPYPLSIWGTPRVWLNGVESTITPLPFDTDRCYHSFQTPTP